MSTIYNTEPQPTAKVVLHTTSGDLSLELFAKQTPLASRNFLQLCYDGYYDNTIFHRLIPGFIIQGGDPSGTGAGGQSSFDKGTPFEDEFHGRLKFNRRGLLGMANGGSKNENGSQFFITLGKTEELQNKHTLFGRVEGDTLYNLVRMGEAELTEEKESDRPVYPTKIIDADVIVNPFEGVVKRKLVEEARIDQPSLPKKRKKTFAKQLLSFEDGEEGSSNIELNRANPNLIDIEPVANTSEPPQVHLAKSLRPKPSSVKSHSLPSQQDIPSRTRTSEVSMPMSRSPELSEAEKQRQQLEVTEAHIEKLRTSMKRNSPSPEKAVPIKPSLLAGMIPATAMKGRKRKQDSLVAASELSREGQRALDAFNAFGVKLDCLSHSLEREPQMNNPIQKSKRAHNEANAHGTGQMQHNEHETALCDLHFISNCQSCSKWDKEDDGDVERNIDVGRAWMSHQLTFEKDRLGKDLEWKRQNEQILEVIDPATKARDIRRAKR